MHCPSCGQQQVSNDTKFCSRCGMPLGLVSELLVHGGFLPQLAALDKKKKTIFTKKNGVVFGVFWFMKMAHADEVPITEPLVIQQVKDKPNANCTYVPRKSDPVDVYCQEVKGKVTVKVRICGIDYYAEVYCK